MKKIIGIIAGVLVVAGFMGPSGLGPGADGPRGTEGHVAAASWDWPQ